MTLTGINVAKIDSCAFPVAFRMLENNLFAKILNFDHNSRGFVEDVNGGVTQSRFITWERDRLIYSNFELGYLAANLNGRRSAYLATSQRKQLPLAVVC